jgi:hypothetical protein
MHSQPSLSYAAALALSWALTWRLALAHVVVLLILAMLLIAFGSPHRGANAISFYSVCVLLEWLLAWPFVIKRALAPQVIFPRLSPGADVDPNRIRVRYRVAAVIGVVADLTSLVPVAAAVLLLHLAGVSIRSAGAIAIFFLLIRTFAVLPLGIRALARRLLQEVP